MNNRSEIRWAPFESIFHSKEVIDDLTQKKEIHSKPTLSEDELEVLERNILEAIHTKSYVQILFYYKGKNFVKTGRIVHILKPSLQIVFEDHTSLYFEQVLGLQFIN